MTRHIVTACDDTTVDDLFALVNSVRVNSSDDIPISVIPYRRMKRPLPASVDAIGDYAWLMEWEDWFARVWQASAPGRSHPLTDGQLRRLRHLCAFAGSWDQFVFLPVTSRVSGSLAGTFDSIEDGSVVTTAPAQRHGRHDPLLGQVFAARGRLFDRSERQQILSRLEDTPDWLRDELSASVSAGDTIVRLMFRSTGMKTTRLGTGHGIITSDAVAPRGQGLRGKQAPLGVRCSRAGRFLARLWSLRCARLLTPGTGATRETSARDRRIFNVFGRSRKIVNAREIRVAGLKRTGNHAIVNWIEKQTSGPMLFLNDQRVGLNPYYREYFSFCADSAIEDFPGPEELFRQHDFWAAHAAGLVTRKELLVVSYEDYRLEQVFGGAMEEVHDAQLGRSAERHDVLILRDPYNLLASRIAGDMFYAREAARVGDLMDLWKSYAREFLGLTEHLTHRRVVINYNRWAEDTSYRETIARQLGIAFTDEGSTDVRRWGGGSSFDGLLFDGNASDMKIFDRWRHYAGSEFFMSLCDDPELKALSDEIFGPMPELERALRG